MFGKKEGAFFISKCHVTFDCARKHTYVVGGVIGVGVVDAWPLSGTREMRSSQTCSSKKRLPFLSLDVAALCRRLERL